MAGLGRMTEAEMMERVERMTEAEMVEGVERMTEAEGMERMAGKKEMPDYQTCFRE